MRSLLALCSALLLMLLLPMASMQSVYGDTKPRFYVFAPLHCQPCEDIVQHLTELYGEYSIVLYDLGNSTYAKCYEGIVDLVAPGNYSTPLIGVFRNEDLKAVTIGGILKEAWNGIVEASYEGVAIYISEGNMYISKTTQPKKVIQNEDEIRLLTELFTTPRTEGPPTKDALTLLPLVVFAAAADAINPCELNSFLLLITLISINAGSERRGAVLKAGLAFSAAVFMTYYAMGLGLLKALEHFHQLRLLIAAIGLTVGVLEVAEFLGMRRKHVPDLFRRKITETLEKAFNPYTSFIAGAIVSALLLPCTSGPYFVALGLIANEATLIGGLGLLTFYNAIIILPFLAITLTVYTLTMRTFKLKRWMSKRQRWLRLFAGIAMMSLSLLFVSLEFL